MNHLERIRERQATLQAEYSPDSGLTYTEFMFSKLVDAEEKLAKLQAWEKKAWHFLSQLPYTPEELHDSEDEE